MKTNSLLFVLVSIFLTPDVSGQEFAAPHYEHLKDLEYFVGEWEGRYDPPGNVPPGMCYVSATWAGYKTYVHFKVTFTPDHSDVVLNPMTVIIGFNGKTQKPHAWDFGALSQAESAAEISKDKIVMANEGVSLQGDERSRTITYELRTADEMVVTNANIILKGEGQPDDPVLTLKRKNDGSK